MEAAATQTVSEGEQQVFPASRLWLGTLGIVVACALASTAIIVASGGTGALCIFFIGAAIFGPASALFYAIRREVILGSENVTVRKPKGEATLVIPWEEIADATYELSPSRRYNQVRVTLTDGKEKLITEHQVRRLRQIGAAIKARIPATTTAPRP
jgi:hypothetical protein